ncbi:MAG: efflux RND transporter periplasmic adaptor subunit [bacterium]
MTEKNLQHHETIHEPKVAKQPWWKNKRTIITAQIMGALFVAIFVFWFIYLMPFVSTDDARIDADTIKIANLGTTGQIIKVFVKEGDKVEAGTILAELDHASAEAQLSRVQAASHFAKIDLKRTKAIASQQGLSQQSVDKTIQMNTITQADLKLAEIALDRTYIKSPVSGIVVQKSAQEGNILESNQTAFMVADIEHASISANILEKSVGVVKNGQVVFIKIDEGGKLKGKVVDVRRAAASVFALIPSDNASGNFVKVEQRIPIKIELEPNHTKNLRVGQSVEIKIKVR